MTVIMASVLSGRGVLQLGGADARSFLQGIITNNVEKLTPDSMVYAALLTPQGKFLFDFFISTDPDDAEALLLDCDGARADALAKRLTMYRLRAKVTIDDVSAEKSVLALWREDGAALSDGPGHNDPRHEAMGRRAILPRGTAEDAAKAAGATIIAEDQWHSHRISLGIGDAAEDFEPDRTFPLEVNMAEMNGIDFHKGCFIGQEVTSRTKRRGSIRKRLLPADVAGDMPAPGTPIKGGAREVGTIYSVDAENARVLALLRLDLIRGAVLEAGNAEIRPDIPSWLMLDLDKAEGEGAGDDGER